MLRHRLDELKGLITVTRGQNPAEIGVPARVLREQHGTVLTGDELRAQDRLESMFTRHFKKADCAIESIGVGERERVLSL